MTNKGKLRPGLKGMVNIESIIEADAEHIEAQSCIIRSQPDADYP